MANISDQVRKAIKGCGMSRYAIAKKTGVSEGMLSKFMSGQNELTLRSLNRIAPTIGVRIVVDKPSLKKK